VTPEKKALRKMRGPLAILAREIALEARTRRVRIEATFVHRKGEKDSISVRLFVGTDALNERGPQGEVQPDGTTLLREVEAVLEKKLKELP
jgi:hypothetical protein